MKRNIKKGRILSLFLVIALLCTLLPASIVSAGIKPSDPADWGNAKWIWGSSNPGTTATSNRNIVQYFRRDFMLESVPSKSELMVAADTKYWMWINGQEVVWEGQLVRGPSGPSHFANTSGSGGTLKQQTSARNDSSYFDTIDVTSYLKEGSNSICVMVWHWNNTSTHNNPSRYGGLILASDLVDSYNLRTVSTGDGLWRTKKSPAHNTTVAPIGQASLNPTPNVTYDAGADIDWKNPSYARFVSDGWETATTYGPAGGTEEFYGWGPLVARPIPQWKDFGRFDLKAENKILFSSPTPHNPAANPTLAKPAVQDGETNVQYYARVKAPSGYQTMADWIPQSGNNMRFTFPAGSGLDANNSRWIVGVLPYNLQMVAWIQLSADTPAGQQIYVRSEPFNQSSTQNVFVTKAGAQLLEGVNWFNGEFLYFLVPNTITDEMILGLGSRETGHAFEGMRNTTSMATDTTADVGGLRDFAGHFDSKIKSDDATITGVNVQGITAIPSGVTSMTFSGGHTWGNPSYKVNDEGPTADNNFYDELWKKAVRCMYVTMRDSYYDCPDRERGQYIGDAVNEFEETYYSLGTSGYDMIAKAYKEHANWQWEFSWAGAPERTFYAMSNVRPGILTQEIYTQSLTAIYSLKDYWNFVGDTDVIENNWTKYFNYLTNWNMNTTGEYAGLLNRTRPQGDPPGYSTLSDWCDWGSNIDRTLWYTGIYYGAMKSLWEIANDPKSGIEMTTEQSTFLSERMASIEDNYYKYWDEARGGYRASDHTSRTDNGTDVDDRGNALGVILGLIPESRYPEIRDLFMGYGMHSTGRHENASIYLEKYVQEALYMMGYAEDAMYRMARRHIRIVNDKDWTSMPEHWGNYWYGTVSGQGTKNHGWSGGSMIAMSRRAAGVEPTSSGYSTWHVVPQMANFESIDCKVPAIIGDIDVKLDSTKGKLKMSVTSPGKDCEIFVPLTDGMSAVQTGGATAEYLGVQSKYNNEYAVYAVDAAGTYSFETVVSADMGIKAQQPKVVKGANANFTVYGDFNQANVFHIKGSYTGSVAPTYTLASGMTCVAGPNTPKLTDGDIDIIVTKANAYVSGTQELVTFNFPTTAAGSITVNFASAVVSGAEDITDDETTYEVPATISPASATVTIYENMAAICDLNGDGKVSAADLSLAMKYYGATSSDPNWAAAQKCDVTGDGLVDMADLIMILGNYTP